MNKEKTKFIYESVLESEGQAYTDIKNLLSETNIHWKIINRIMLAISEAFTNAMIHGNKFIPDKKIEIDIAINDKWVTADVIDEGYCDITAVERREPPDSMQEGGRGVDLIESMASEVEIRKNSRTGGLQVSMKFDLSINEEIKNHHILRR